jgi:PBP1b-binding outer membrane lipoprotein LpoB
MKIVALIILPVFFLAACAEEPAPKKTVHHTKKAKSDNAEDFRAVEKPASYAQ